MTWRFLADEFESGDLAAPAVYQGLTIRKNLLIKAVRTWIVSYNNPTYTSLSLKIYSNAGGFPDALLASSSPVIKSSLGSATYFAKEIYFELADFSAAKNTTYFLSLDGADYSYASGSHLAWVRGWPDPIYRETYTPTAVNATLAPYQIYLVGAKF